jgi:hypothetical protein
MILLLIGIASALENVTIVLVAVGVELSRE